MRRFKTDIYRVGGGKREEFLHECAVAEEGILQRLDVRAVKGDHAGDVSAVFQVQPQGDKWDALVIGIKRIIGVYRRSGGGLFHLVTVFIRQFPDLRGRVVDYVPVPDVGFVCDPSAEGIPQTEHHQLFGKGVVADKGEGFHLIGGWHGVEFRLIQQRSVQHDNKGNQHRYRHELKGAVGVSDVEGQQQLHSPEAAEHNEGERESGDNRAADNRAAIEKISKSIP